MRNITNAVFDGSRRKAITCPLFQYDYGQILKISGVELPASYQVQFSNTEDGGISKTMLGDADGVQIPDEYLLTGEYIYAFIFLHEGTDDGETEYVIEIPVIRRPVPSEETPTPAEQSLIDQLLEQLNQGVEAAEAAADQAGQAAADAVAGMIDDTLTIQGKAADAKATGDEITQLKSDFTDILTSETLSRTWAQGNINSSTGANSGTASNRIRLYSHQHVDVKMDVTVPSGIKVFVYKYTTQEAAGFIGPDGYGWHTESFSVDGGVYYRFVAAYTDDTAILPEVGASVILTLYNYTDTTLTESGKAADAKATGEQIENISESYLKGSFERGDWRSDIPFTKLNNRDWRVRSSGMITYPYDVELIAKDGFRFYAMTYKDETEFLYPLSSSIHYQTIPANTPFTITINKEDEASGDVADVETNRKAIIVLRRRFETYAVNWQPLQRNQALIEAHRGWMGDTATYPENSLPAFEKGAELGAWMLETDIAETTDGYFYCMHDSTVDRTTDGTGTIAKMTSGEVQSLHLIGGDGTLTVPTLQQFLEVCKINNICAHIEIKSLQNGAESMKKVMEAVDAYGLTRQTSFNAHSFAVADYIHTINPFVPVHFVNDDFTSTFADFTARMNAFECYGCIRAGADNLGDSPSAYLEQIAELHKRKMITNKLTSSWSAQKAWLRVGIDVIVSNNNLSKPTA